MGFSLDIDFDFAEFESFLDDKFYKANVNGLRQGLNRAAKGVVVESDKQIRNEFPLGKGGQTTFKQRIKKDISFPFSGKAKGNDLNNIHARVEVRSDRAVQMIRAVKPAKISNSPGKGPFPSAEVRRGRKFSVKNAFVQRGKNNNLLLFRRKRKKPGGRKPAIIAQRLKRISLMLQDKNVWPDFQSNSNQRLMTEVSRAISNQLNRLK